MKTSRLLTLIVCITMFQATFAAQERERSRETDDIRNRRPADDMRDRRPTDEMRDRGPADDMRDRRESASQSATDRPWRATLEKCREMKKAGKISKTMKKECKAAREMRKNSKQ